MMTLQRSGDALNDIGLSVSESKLLLNTVQQSVVQQQADEYTRQHIQCPHCLSARRIKGQQKIQYRTLFGVIPVSGLRVYRLWELVGIINDNLGNAGFFVVGLFILFWLISILNYKWKGYDALAIDDVRSV